MRHAPDVKQELQPPLLAYEVGAISCRTILGDCKKRVQMFECRTFTCLHTSKLKKTQKDGPFETLMFCLRQRPYLVGVPIHFLSTFYPDGKYPNMKTCAKILRMREKRVFFCTFLRSTRKILGLFLKRCKEGVRVGPGADRLPTSLGVSVPPPQPP